MLILILLIALFLFGAVVGALIMLVIGIQTTERRASLAETPEPHSRAEIASRRVLSVHVHDTRGVR